MILVAQSQPGKGFGVMTNNYGVNAFRDRNLPGIVFAHALIGAALTEGLPLALLASNRLPAKGAKRFTHSFDVIGIRV